MKRNLLSLCILFGSLVNAQVYSNGNFSTGTVTSTGATPTVAPVGYTWSELQPPNTSLGASGYVSATTNFRLADDFVIPANESWAISSIDVFAYQTSSLALPIDQMTARIYSGILGTGTVVFGDATTNIMNVASSGDSFIYRIGTTVNTSRKVWRIRGNVTQTLNPGTYWLDYQVHAINDGAVFFPLVTIPGLTSPPGANAQQFNLVWAPLTDAGSASVQALPFIINYVATSLGTSEARQMDSRVVVFPNPTADYFKISLPSESLGAKTEISLYDFSGKRVKSFKVSERYDVADLATGTYLIKVNDGKNIKTAKLIKE